MKTAEDTIKTLGLSRDTDGTWSRMMFRSPVLTQATIRRHAASSEYRLIPGSVKLPWYRSKTDEIWIYHAGTPAVQLLLFPDGSFLERVIGPDPLAGDFPQSIVPCGVWQCTVVPGKNDWGLFGILRVPASESADRVTGEPTVLAKQFPEAAERMRELELI